MPATEKMRWTVVLTHEGDSAIYGVYTDIGTADCAAIRVRASLADVASDSPSRVDRDIAIMTKVTVKRILPQRSAKQILKSWIGG